MTEREAYDVVVVGGGANGLTAAAHLARGGERVLVLERRFERGGVFASDDYSTPFTYDQALFDLPLDAQAPPVRELGLVEHGLAFVAPELPFAVELDGAATFFGRGGTGLGEPVETLLATALRLARPVLYSPATRAAKLIAEHDPALAHLSPDALVACVDDEASRVLLRYLCASFGAADRDPLGPMRALELALAFDPTLAVGGSKSVPNALFRVAVRAGARCLTSADVLHVDPTGDGFVVCCADGRSFTGRSVVSTLDPVTTFAELLDAPVAGDLTAVAERWQSDSTGMFIAHIGLKGPPPGFSDVSGRHALRTLFGFDEENDVRSHMQAVAAGEVPTRPAGAVSVTSVHDVMRASPGPYGPLHTLRIESPVPFVHPDGDWTHLRVAHREMLLAAVAERLPGGDEVVALFAFADSPRDIERRFRTTRGGGMRHGALSPGQSLTRRPDRTCRDGRTPVPGLYLGGGATHPGIPGSLAEGHLAAAAIRDDESARAVRP